jgi:hypothetical protein
LCIDQELKRRVKVERRLSKRSADSALNPNPFFAGTISIDWRPGLDTAQIQVQNPVESAGLQQRLAWSDFNMGQAAIGHKSKIGIILTAGMPQDNPFIFNCNLEGSRNMANPECGMPI